MKREAESRFAAGDVRGALTLIQRRMVLGDAPEASLYLLRAMLQGALGNDAFYCFDMQEVLSRRDALEREGADVAALAWEEITYGATWRLLFLCGSDVVEDLRRAWLGAPHYALGFAAARDDRQPEAITHFTDALEHHVSAITLWYLAYALARLRRVELTGACLDRLDGCSAQSLAELYRGVPREEVEERRALVEKIRGIMPTG